MCVGRCVVWCHVCFVWFVWGDMVWHIVNMVCILCMDMHYALCVLCGVPCVLHVVLSCMVWCVLSGLYGVLDVVFCGVCGIFSLCGGVVCYVCAV